MKQLILAAVAATLVFASAAQAVTATTSEHTTTTTTMTDADCTKAMAACGTDQACKAALVKDHGCMKAVD